MTKVRYIGLDVHKDSISVAAADEGRDPAKAFAMIPNDLARLLKVLRRLTPKGGSLLPCYEAGPTGYGLYRQLGQAGIACRVIAPSLVHSKAGDRVKTDRRGAVQLAHFPGSASWKDVSTWPYGRMTGPSSLQRPACQKKALAVAMCELDPN